MLISLTSLSSAILNTWNYFSVPAVAPALLNISMIVFSCFAVQYFNPPIIALSWATILGGFLQLVIQIPYLKKIGVLALPRISLSNKGVKKVIYKMLPAMIGVSASQVSMLINSSLLSYLAPGSISWVYYADRLMEFPVGIFGIALSSVLLPLLVQSVYLDDKSEYSRLIDWGLRICIFLSVPSAIVLGILSGPLTSTLFSYGSFTSYDVLMTQHALTAYSFGLVGLIIVKILASGFYSYQDMRTPIKITVITLITSQLMNLAFFWTLKHAALPLSISLAACLNAALLYYQLRRRKMFFPQSGWCKFLKQVILSSLFMAIALLNLLKLMPPWAWENGNMLWRWTHLSILLSLGGSVYLVALVMQGVSLSNLMISRRCYRD
jgi:putative peptidoglycan lipid II flippase